MQPMSEREKQVRSDLFATACEIVVAQSCCNALEVRRLKAKRVGLRRRLRRIEEAAQTCFDFYDEEVW